MATGGTGYVTLVDYKGVSRAKMFDMIPVAAIDVPTEIATLLTRIETIAAAYEPVTFLGVTEFGVKIVAGNQAGAPGGRYNRQAAIQALLTTAGKKGLVTVPGAHDNIFVGDDPDSDVVDLADADLDALLDALVATTHISDGETIASWVSGWRIDKLDNNKTD